MVGNALVDMHAKCGALDEAREVFELLSRPNIVGWNALMAGYSQLGEADAALDMYRRMIARELVVVPDSITFLILLNACSHAGLVREGEKLFDEMDAVHRLTPTLEHYTCMADLFGRAGCFDKLKELLGGFPEPGYLPLFQSILGSCRKWKNAALGRWAFDQIVELDEACAAAYVSLGNIYATASMQLLE
jgi:pentatricopeptide repeat protein